MSSNNGSEFKKNKELYLEKYIKYNKIRVLKVFFLFFYAILFVNKLMIYLFINDYFF